MPSLLRLRGVRKEFSTGVWGGPKVRAVDDVDLDLAPGEVLGLVGESGCGKTTLARCAVGLLEPTSGTVEFDGIDLGKLPVPLLRRKRREFQIIFQDAASSLDPKWTVRKILMEPYEAQGIGSKAEREMWIYELLQAVALDPAMLDRFPAQLSGGQQQRVVIARSLALKPRLLVADEPVSALDASVQAQILNLLAELQKRFNLTLLLISHSLPVVRFLSTRVAVMYLGRIIEESPAGAFFRQPLHPYSKALLESVPALEPDSRRNRPKLKGEPPSPLQPPSGCHFHPRCPEVMSRCRTEGPVLGPVPDHRNVACFLYTRDPR